MIHALPQRLLDQLREIFRYKHYSFKTKQVSLETMKIVKSLPVSLNF
ncbi:hypothetical protein [Polaromonas sp. CG9_12]|nr:hypothetical protein [Polaromonas sp. CG9_12]